MSDDAIFIGVVTHPGSRFREGAGSAESVAAAAERAGFAVELLISDRDDFDAARYPVDGNEPRESAEHQARLEHRWRRYLAAGGGGRSALSDAATLLATRIRRPMKTTGQTLRRLINIDLSHLRVLEAASASGARWALCLEDDAWTDSPDATFAALRELISIGDSRDAQYVVVSESIPASVLGVEPLLSTVHAREGLAGRVFAASRPITNTVCANLVRSDFAGRLAAGIRQRGLIPVAPIDWRVNEVVMDLFDSGELDATSCLWVSPGLFVQRSMHAAS